MVPDLQEAIGAKGGTTFSDSTICYLAKFVHNILFFIGTYLTFFLKLALTFPNSHTPPFLLNLTYCLDI